MCKKCELNQKRNGNNEFWFLKVSDSIMKGEELPYKLAKKLNPIFRKIPEKRKGMEFIPLLDK